jgi:hypothetical protein
MEGIKVIDGEKAYMIINLEYKQIDVPIIIDYNDYKIINSINKTWSINESGMVSCYHTTNDVTSEVYLHEIIMSLKLKDENKEKQQRSILHINKLGIDNRRENLIYDIVNKQTNKNTKKKKRIIELPEESGINPDEIPTYVWYMKPNDSHGERFLVDIGDVQWKTTSSKKLSLRYKLEEAKKYLRELKDERPELFQEYSMNGEFTKDGKELLKSFYIIIKKAGYKHLKKVSTDNLTNTYLKEHGSLTKQEKKLLNSNKLLGGGKKSTKKKK